MIVIHIDNINLNLTLNRLMVCVLVPRVAARGLKPPTMTQFVNFYFSMHIIKGKERAKTG